MCRKLLIGLLPRAWISYGCCPIDQRDRVYHDDYHQSFKSRANILCYLPHDGWRKFILGYLDSILSLTHGMQAYPMSPINDAWIVSNIPNLNARALTTAVLISMANSSGLISSNIFIADEAPRYITALRTNLGAAVGCTIICLTYTTWMRRENRRRDIVQGSLGPRPHFTQGIMGSKDINFRFMP
jgi:hypothetical protein